MSTTLLRNSVAAPSLDVPFKKTIEDLCIASVVTSAAAVVLALLCQMRMCSTRNDKLRCRVILVLSISAVCRSIAQLVLTGQAKHQTDFLGMRVLVFVPSFCAVLNGLLITSAISVDAAIRYGLRSFRLAQRLGNFYEIFSAVLAMAVSQPILYLFGQFEWTGDAIVVSIDKTPFNVAMWMVESAWVALAMGVSLVATMFALLKARKIAKNARNSSKMSIELVLGSTASIRSRIGVSVLYLVAFSASSVWKLAFRAGGSQSKWFLSASCIGEALQPMLVLAVFVIDIIVNIIPERRQEWLSASTLFSVDADEKIKPGASSTFRLESKSFTGWRQTQFIDWQASGPNQHQPQNQAGEKDGIPSDEDIRLWTQEIKRCHLKSETSVYEGDDYSVSDLSFDSVPDRYSGPVIMYPLTK
ncbi:hypothetical protein LPJ59_003570 [Coemansia sp. RSA 2399]|nr:hypothetical protein LPJ59_003570 [Coemansia sp. RSA 2399]